MEGTRFDPDRIYAIEGRYLNRIWAVAKRLYSEDRFKANEMRDLAQELDCCVEDAESLIGEN